MKITTTEEYIEHPMEDVFDIESGTTLITKEEVVSGELVLPGNYDDKDHEIEDQFQEVYDAAMTSFADQAGLLLTSDPKYSARNMEVANAFLNTALAAAKEKSSVKQHKDKLSKTDGPKTVNNNLIMDRNELLKMLKGTTNNQN
jgi:hypothetical protein